MKKTCVLCVMIAFTVFAEQLVVPTLQIPTIQMPSTPLEQEFKQMNRLMEHRKRFIDQRNILGDKNFLNETEVMQSWIRVYDEFATYPDIEYKEIVKSFKMIAEVYVPETAEGYNILKDNLRYYRQRGYDSVLFCFNGQQSLEDMKRCLEFIQAHTDMQIWATYTKPQGLTNSVFDISADKYEQMLTFLAPYLTGYINSWKRTSVHLFKQDNAFMKFTNHTLRDANPNIYLVGEFYYGEVYGLNFTQYKVRPRIVIDFGQNMFPNASGCMIVNYGALYTDFDYLFSNVLKNQIKQHTKFIGLVSARQNKDVIERLFVKQGCIGTITLPGSNDEFNLSKQRMEER